MRSENEGFPPDESATRLTAALADVDPFLTATPEDVADDLQRAFGKARVSSTSSLVTSFPAEATEAAMFYVRPALEAKDREIARLKREGTPGVMHEVDSAFHDLAIKERDYARVQVNNRDAEIARLREQVEQATAAITELAPSQDETAQAIRADERQRIAARLRHEADELDSGALLPLPGHTLSLADFARDTALQLEAGASSPAVNTGEGDRQ